LLRERLKVLKVMNDATGRLDFNEFARMVDLSPNETMAQLSELTKTGHLRRVGNGYGIAEKGKAALRALIPVPVGAEFEFYIGVGKPSGFSAANLVEFYEIIKRIDAASLEFHVYRKDFEMWARNTLGNPAFAEEFANMERTGLKGEALRSAITKSVESKYNLP